MRNFKNELTAAWIQADCDIRTNKNRKLMLIMAALMIALMATMVFAFADETASTIQNGVTSGAEQIYNIIKAIVTPIAAVIVAVCAIKVLFGGERGMEAAKKTLLSVVIVIALIYAAPLIIVQVRGWFEGMGTGDVFKKVS